MTKAVQPCRASLIERAAEVYDFGEALRGRRADPVDISPDMPAPRSTASRPTAPRPTAPRPTEPRGVREPVDLAHLAQAGLLVPGAAVSALAEEFRIAKRQLLRHALAASPGDARARSVLVCSAAAAEGKTFCAVNLALSMAAEADLEIVLVDADFAKPDVCATLGLPEGRPGLLDALADPRRDVESLLMRTDVDRLLVLPAGTRSRNDTELVAQRRTSEVLGALAADERRILLFDSAPVLAASPASVLAQHVGQTLLVVRADRTSEAELRDAVQLLDGSDAVALLLNGIRFAPGGRRFGSYHGETE